RRTRDQRDMRRALEDLLAFLLRHAAENGKALPFLAQLLEIGEAVEDLLLGLIADRAGVIEDEVGVFLARDLPVALGDERAHDLFRVVEVHLATEGLDVESFGLRTQSIPVRNQYSAGESCGPRAASLFLQTQTWILVSAG